MSDPRALIGHSEAVAIFVAALLGEEGFGRCQAIGFLDRDGVLEAGVVYHNYNPEGGVIELSAAGVHPRWCTRGRVRLIFEYPFDQLRCQMAIARISERNEVALSVWRRLGAEPHRIPRLYGRDEAAIIWALTEEQWRGGKYSR